MANQITFTIEKMEEPQTIQGKNAATFTKREVFGKYASEPDRYCALSLWGDLTTHEKLAVGNSITAEFRIDSREYQGKYFTDLTITKIL